MEGTEKKLDRIKKFNSSVGANEENRFHHQPSPTPVPLMLGCAYERPLPSHKQRSLFLRWRTKREKAPAEPGPSAEDTQADMARQLMNNPLYSAAL